MGVSDSETETIRLDEAPEYTPRRLIYDDHDLTADDIPRTLHGRRPKSGMWQERVGVHGLRARGAVAERSVDLFGDTYNPHYGKLPGDLSHLSTDELLELDKVEDDFTGFEMDAVGISVYNVAGAGRWELICLESKDKDPAKGGVVTSSEVSRLVSLSEAANATAVMLRSCPMTKPARRMATLNRVQDFTLTEWIQCDHTSQNPRDKLFNRFGHGEGRADTRSVMWHTYVDVPPACELFDTENNDITATDNYRTYRDTSEK
ncbi:hypothetical protein [Haloferax prahovense]|uniref:hypothetical protein n=1 Tax=Haloferax prahovense TaxID=381852 RepID=UPI001267AC63|nr:hypothetical protein [Haloferax prahovense]